MYDFTIRLIEIEMETSTNIFLDEKNKSFLSVYEKFQFDPDMAVLPIMVARWNESVYDAIITYQNQVSLNKFGNLTGIKFTDLLKNVCQASEFEMIEDLENMTSIALAGVLNGANVKFHASLRKNIIQISISDNTKILEYRDAKKRSELIDSFLMIGSHELKTPLNGIMGMSSVLLEEEIDKDIKAMIELILESSKTLSGVVDKMLKNIYLSDDSQNTGIVEEISLIDEFISFMPLISRYLSPYILSFEDFDLKRNTKVTLPKGAISEILMEIIINLRRNTKPGEKISFKGKKIKSGILLRIENDNEGIPTEYLDKVFEPFFRYQDKLNHSSGFDYGKAGMGMGLTILKRYIQQVGGKIWFENKRQYKKGIANTTILNIVFPVKQ